MHRDASHCPECVPHGFAGQAYADRCPARRAALRMVPPLLPSLLAILISTSAGPAGAQLAYEVAPTKASQYARPLYAFDAYTLARLNWPRVLFLDVRTRPEVELLGTASLVDANVPVEVHTWPFAWDTLRRRLALERSPDFLAGVEHQRRRKGLTEADAVLLTCDNGERAAMAADVLGRAGYTQIYTVADGMEGDQHDAATPSGRRALNGWKLSGLPWSHVKDPARFGLESHASAR